MLKNKIIESIKWSERIFKTDMIYVVKNGSWSAFGQFVSIGFSFILSISFAHFLPKEVYGNYKFILSLTSIIGGLSLSGIGTAIIQAIAQGKERVLPDSVKVSLKWGLIVTGVSFATAIYYFINDNIAISLAMIVFGICSPIINSYGMYGLYWVGKKDFQTSTLYFIFSQILNTIVILISVLLTTNALILVSVGFIFSAIFSFLSYEYVVKRNHINNIGDDSMITYGKHLSFMNFFGNLANQLDKILIFHWIGPAQLAVYSFALVIPEQVRGSYKSIFGITLPKFSVLSGDRLRKSIIDKVFRLTAISAVIVIVYAICAPYFFEIFLPKYASSVIYSQIYMIGLMAIPGITLFSTYFQVIKDTKTLYKITSLSNAVTIFYSFILIYYFGLWGAVIENGISWMTMFIIGGYFFVKSKQD